MVFRHNNLQEFRENGAENKKHPVRGSPVVVLMRDIRGELPDRKATVTQIPTLYTGGEQKKHLTICLTMWWISYNSNNKMTPVSIQNTGQIKVGRKTNKQMMTQASSVREPL